MLRLFVWCSQIGLLSFMRIYSIQRIKFQQFRLPFNPNLFLFHFTQFFFQTHNYQANENLKKRSKTMKPMLDIDSFFVCLSKFNKFLLSISDEKSNSLRFWSLWFSFVLKCIYFFSNWMLDNCCIRTIVIVLHSNDWWFH